MVNLLNPTNLKHLILIKGWRAAARQANLDRAAYAVFSSSPPNYYQLIISP
jgi:hypothetical protein